MKSNIQNPGNIVSNGNVTFNNGNLNSLVNYYPNIINEESMNFPSKSFYKVKEKRINSLDNKKYVYSGKKTKLNDI